MYCCNRKYVTRELSINCDSMISVTRVLSMYCCSMISVTGVLLMYFMVMFWKMKALGQGKEKIIVWVKHRKS